MAAVAGASENEATAIETITPMLDKDGAWRVGLLHQVSPDEPADASGS